MSKDFKNPYLQHSWGKTADQKRKEQEYNRRYYELHKKDKWGVGEETRQAPSTSENVSSNRPMARQKNVTEGGNGVQRRGEGLNTGSVGTNQYGRSEVVGAVRDKKDSEVRYYPHHKGDPSEVLDAIRARKRVHAPSQAVPPSQINTNASTYGRPVQKVNPYKSDAYANSARTNGVTASPSSIEARKAVGRYRDSRAASSVARSNAAAESEQARMNASEAKIRRRNSSIARAEAAAASAQASQNKASERYKDYEKSGLFKKQETDKRAEAEKNAQYQNRQNEIKKAISKKNGIQSEITNINNTIKRLQKEDPKKNAIKIDSLYKQLDQKKEAYKNMQAYINALNF